MKFFTLFCTGIVVILSTACGNGGPSKPQKDSPPTSIPSGSAPSTASSSSSGASFTTSTQFIEPPMVNIPAGDFLMGSDADASTKPIHKVTLKSFNLGKYEVTNEEFRRFINDTHYATTKTCTQMKDQNWFGDMTRDWENHTLRGSEFEPVVCIGWNAMQAYVDWLAQKTGKKYRLTSNAEWEYASRAGSSTKYFFGNDETQTCRYGNIGDRSQEAAFRRDYGLESVTHTGVANCDDGAGYLSIVGMYEPNAFGVYDTIGNVSEFLQDCAHENYVGAPTDGSAWITGDCNSHTIRPSSWHWLGSSFAEIAALPNDFYGAIEGFRVAEDITTTTTTPIESSTSEFENALQDAQEVERNRRVNVAPLN